MEKDDQVVTVNIRVKKSLKDGFEKVIQAQDQSITQAVIGFFEVTVKNKTLPFTPVTDYFTPQEYFKTATEKAEELGLILNALINSKELTESAAQIALNMLNKTTSYISAHLEEINKFENGLYRSENMTFTVANLTWANLLREISQAEYNLRAFEEFSVRRDALAVNVEEIARLCRVLRRYLSGEKAELIKWSDLMTPRPLASLPVKQVTTPLSACLEYEAGTATCSLLMADPHVEDILEHVGQDTAFRLYVYGTDASARLNLTQSLTAIFGRRVVIFADAGPQEAAEAWRLYTSGKGAVLEVDAPDYITMNDTLYAGRTVLIEDLPEVDISQNVDKQSWADAISNTMRLPAEHITIPGVKEK